MKKVVISVIHFLFISLFLFSTQGFSSLVENNIDVSKVISPINPQIFSSYQPSILDTATNIINNKTAEIKNIKNDLGGLSSDLSKNIGQLYAFLQKIIENPFGFVNMPSSMKQFEVFGHSLLLKFLIIILGALGIFFIIRQFIHHVWVHHTHAIGQDIQNADRIFYFVMPWLGFLITGIILSQSLDLPYLLQNALSSIFFIIATGFPVRHISLMNNNINIKWYHLIPQNNLKEESSTHIYKWIIYLIILGMLSILGILFFALFIPFASSYGGFISHSFITFEFPALAFSIDGIIYFYLANFCIFLVILEQHIDQRKFEEQKLASKLSLSRLNYMCHHYRRFWYIICYVFIGSAYAGWVGWNYDLISYGILRFLLISALSLVALLSNDIVGKVINYLAENLSEKLFSLKIQTLLNTKKLISHVSHFIYYFFMAYLVLYINGAYKSLSKIINFIEILLEKTIIIGFVIGSTFIIQNFFLSLIQKIISSRTEIEISARSGNRLYTFLTLFKALIPSLCWIPASIIIFVFCGLEGRIILMIFAGLGALLVFVGQNVVQDMIKGIIYILEDVVVIGEEITVNNLTCGRIERLSLHSLSIRDYNGYVHTFSFGKINSILSTEWHYVNLVIEIGLSYTANADKALIVMSEVMDSMIKDKAYKKFFIGEKFEGGIFNFGDHSVILKGRIRIKPGKMTTLKNEYNRRLKNAFDENDILFSTLEADHVQTKKLENNKKDLSHQT